MKIKRWLAVWATLFLCIASNASAQYDKYAVRFSYPAGPTTITQASSGFDLLSDALSYAIEGDRYGIVRLVARNATDTFEMDEGIATSRSGVLIELAPQTIVVAAPTANGFISWTGGSDVGIVGQGKIRVDTLSPSQTIVKFDNCGSARIEGIKLEASVSGATSDAPVTMLELDSCDSARVSGISGHPAAGIRIVFINECQSTTISDSQFCPKLNEEERHCYRVFDVLGGAQTIIRGCTVRALGTTSALLDSVIRMQETADTGQFGNQMTGNIIEDVACRNPVHLLGTKNFKFVSNRIAYSLGIDTANFVDRFDSPFYLENSTQTESSDQPDYGAHGLIANNDFDGNSYYSAPELYIRAAGKVEVRGNHFAHLASEYTAIVDADHTQNITIEGNYFDGFYPNPAWSSKAPIFIVQRLADNDGGIDEAIGTIASNNLWEYCENIVVQNNYAEGYRLGLPFASGGFATFPYTAGVRGGYYFSGIQGFAQTIESTALSIDTSTNTLNAASGTPFGSIVAGDAIMVLGFTEIKNNGLRIVVSVSDSSNIVLAVIPDNNSPSVENTSTAVGPFSNSVITTTTITRPSGSWTSDLYEVGGWILIENAEDAGNNGYWYVTGVTSTVLTVAQGGLTANAADSAATYKRVGVGYDFVTEAAGDTVRLFVFQRNNASGLGTVSPTSPLQTNVFGRNIKTQ